MDMDVIGDFRYADDEFKDQDDNLRLVMKGMDNSMYIQLWTQYWEKKALKIQDTWHTFFMAGL